MNGVANGWTTGRRIAVATAIAGTLDILAAVVLTLIAHRAPAAMLRGVASGPFPAAVDWGTAGSLLGLVTHFVLMAIMASVFVLAADHWVALKRRWIVAALGYGIVTWVAMNLVVVPLRFGTMPSATSAVIQLFCHIVLVALPIAAVARR
ncbi:MAG TPA: hypothetical protein VM657_01540 [Sphingomonas sp.]|nr:hypothetical protein [Sphingomonas sp.]